MAETTEEAFLWIIITIVFVLLGIWFKIAIAMEIKARASISPEEKQQRKKEILEKGGVHANAVVKKITQTRLWTRIKGAYYFRVALVLEIEYDGWIWEINDKYMMDLVNPVRVGDILPVVVYFKTGECIILK